MTDNKLDQSTVGSEGIQLATLGGGCFWCLEAIFKELRGVVKVDSGYAGGTTANPSYQQVCTGETGHAEVIQITFNPSEVSFRDLLQMFFTIHDPTTLNRQGADVGSQYRSVVFYHDENQHNITLQVIEEVRKAGIWPLPLVTEVTPLSNYFIAEDYHRDYYERNPNQGYCRAVIEPKVAKFRKHFYDRLKR